MRRVVRFANVKKSDFLEVANRIKSSEGATYHIRKPTNSNPDFVDVEAVLISEDEGAIDSIFTASYVGPPY